MSEGHQHILFCGGLVRHYTDVGGYPLFYVTKDYSVLCPDCVQENLEQCETANEAQWTVIAHDVNWEDPDLYCDHCSTAIEAAYTE